jgi:hypothetical protein
MAVHVVDNIFIGNAADAYKFKEMKCPKLIVACGKAMVEFDANLNLDLSDAVFDMGFLPTIFDYITQHQQCPILICCDTAEALSPGVMIAYLMTFHNMSFGTALTFLSRIKKIHLTPHIVTQLINFNPLDIPAIIDIAYFKHF